MKVLQITAFSGWGCTGRIAQGICETLISEGHEVAIAWGRIDCAPDYINKIKIGNKLDQIMHGLYTRITDRCGFGSKKVTKDFLDELERFKPDVVHMHIMHGYYINLEILFAYLAKKNIPIVWTFHDCWAFTGHCPYFERVSCYKWKEQCNHCQQRMHHPQSWFIDNSKKNYAKKKAIFTQVENMTIVTPSYWLKSLVEESFFQKYPVQMIHNGIDTTRFKKTDGIIREKYGISQKKILLGVSSTWAEGKGLKDFISLAELCKGDYQVVLVGLNKKQLRDLPSGVIGVGRTDSIEELAQLYTAAFAFLNLTYEDNYPTTNLEAIACGTPVITYRTGGSVEIVEETGFGKIVEQGDIEGILAALDDICKLKERIVNSKALEQKERFKEYVELYKKVVAGR